MWDVQFSPNAIRDYNSLDRTIRRRINAALDRLCTDPLHQPNIKRLVGPLAGQLRFRVGDWRIAYYVRAELRRIVIVRIAHRREVYD